MKKLITNPSKRRVFDLFLLLAILFTAGYTIWQTWLIREDIGKLYTEVYKEEESYDDFSEKAPEANVEFRIVNQYVETLDVADPDSYSVIGDTEYVPTATRVVELEVTNNEEWVYSSYNSIGTIDENGKLIRTVTGIRSSQDKSLNSNGYTLELAPGGKGILYLYFEDTGEEITKLYDIDASKEISLY